MRDLETIDAEPCCGWRPAVMVHGRAGGEFCYFVIHAVAWPVADQSASGQLGTLIQQFVYRPDRRQDSVVFLA